MFVDNPDIYFNAKPKPLKICIIGGNESIYNDIYKTYGTKRIRMDNIFHEIETNRYSDISVLFYDQVNI